MPSSALDRFLPSYRHNEVHETLIAASPEAVLRAVDAVTAREIPGARVLLGIRSLPAVLLRRPRRGRDADRPILEVAVTGGFIVLERSAEEVVLGVIGRFWRLATRDIVDLAKPEDFVAFTGEGYARAAINFLVAQENGKTRLRTETRIQPLGAEAARRFGLYWLLVHPGSALLRRAWLRAVRRRAEARS
jgi:hypothetical protein